MTPVQRFTARVWLTLWALTRPRRKKENTRG